MNYFSEELESLSLADIESGIVRARALSGASGETAALVLEILKSRFDEIDSYIVVNILFVRGVMNRKAEGSKSARIHGHSPVHVTSLDGIKKKFLIPERALDFDEFLCDSFIHR